MNQKIGIVDVGGGYRGVYAVGVMDRLMQMGLWFDLGVGVSAGSANLASYCARQPRRNLKFYTEYGLRKEYAGIGNYLRSRSYIDLSYIYGTLTNSDGEYPLNFDSMMANPMDTLTVITNAQTGEPRYVRKEELIRDQYIPFMASSAIPGICRPVLYEGVPCYDGALGDPVPIRKAFDLGCDKVVLILTLPEDTIRSPAKDARLARRICREYPAAAEALAARAEKYNEGVALDMGCFLTLPSDYAKTLEEYGIEAAVFNPFQPFLTVKQNNRDHRKIAVIDGTVAFTGGINQADEYINAVEKYGHWRDSAIMLKGDTAWSFALIFLQMWFL